MTTVDGRVLAERFATFCRDTPAEGTRRLGRVRRLRRGDRRRDPAHAGAHEPRDERPRRDARRRVARPRRAPRRRPRAARRPPTAAPACPKRSWRGSSSRSTRRKTSETARELRPRRLPSDRPHPPRQPSRCSDRSGRNDDPARPPRHRRRGARRRPRSGRDRICPDSTGPACSSSTTKPPSSTPPSMVVAPRAGSRSARAARRRPAACWSAVTVDRRRHRPRHAGHDRREFLSWLERERPDLPRRRDVRHPRAGRARRRSGRTYAPALDKPFTATKLLDAIRGALGGNR